MFVQTNIALVLLTEDHVFLAAPHAEVLADSRLAALPLSLQLLLELFVTFPLHYTSIHSLPSHTFVEIVKETAFHSDTLETLLFVLDLLFCASLRSFFAFACLTFQLLFALVSHFEKICVYRLFLPSRDSFGRRILVEKLDCTCLLLDLTLPRRFYRFTSH